MIEDQLGFKTFERNRRLVVKLHFILYEESKVSYGSAYYRRQLALIRQETSYNNARRRHAI